MSSSKDSWHGYAYKDGELQVNGKVIKFINKFCIDYSDRVSLKISKSIPEPQRLYYKCEKKTYNVFRWWEPTKQEYRIIARGVRLLDDDFEDNFEMAAEENKVLEAVNKFVTKSDSMIRLLEIILIMLSLCILYLWQFS